ncbi:hypothetical protein [Nocardioides daphniae]|uniref:Uncharacterized protein n=1 Tax=Nocardioides daphniae TaxID=402297 RepID=A0A4P7U9P4_9ACTN|nr:hypothetical protein [Nocardioides daphniae]QCC76334.1 hypothetical protein E2C04_02330 [Nocardioides daphniae]GGD07808.1 hypothetical protein GCM10007231_03190 [Nocardioides daphniae]
MTRRTPVLAPRLLVAVVAAAGAVLLSSCSGPLAKVLDPGPAPTLERAWTVPGLNLKPEATGDHHWLTRAFQRNGIGWGTTFTYMGTQAVDARTGTIQTMQLDRALRWCWGLAAVSPGGRAPLLVASARKPAPDDPRTCNRLAVFDLSTGKVEVVAEDLDLTSLSPRISFAVDDELAALVDDTGRVVCRRLDDGAAVAADDATCQALRDHHTHADLPELVDPAGEPVPLAFGAATDADRVELGRTDDVLLVRDRVEESLADGTLESGYAVRAHDLDSGRTLWQEALTQDPYGGAWSRDVTYFVAPSGVARVSYEHPDNVLVASSTPMVITAVDPRTGEELKEVARINGGWFSHQFGEMTVALTDQELQLNATISGFVLPQW